MSLAHLAHNIVHAAQAGMRAYKDAQGVGGVTAAFGRGTKLGPWLARHDPTASYKAAKAAVNAGASRSEALTAALKAHGRFLGEVGQSTGLGAAKIMKGGAILAAVSEEAGGEPKPGEHHGMLHRAEERASGPVKQYINPATDKVFGTSRGADLARMAGAGAIATASFIAGGKGKIPMRLAMIGGLSMGIPSVNAIQRTVHRFKEGGGFHNPVGGVANATGLGPTGAKVATGALGAIGAAGGALLAKKLGGGTVRAAKALARAPAAMKAANAERAGNMVARQVRNFMGPAPVAAAPARSADFKAAAKAFTAKRGAAAAKPAAVAGRKPRGFQNKANRDAAHAARKAKRGG